MKVLIACEESQTVCKAFRARGHEAYSCDIQEPSGGHPEWHIKGDALIAIRGGTLTTLDGKSHNIDGWDLLIAHPPCTYLSNAGASRLFRIIDGKTWIDKERLIKGFAGKRFFMELYNADIPRVCVENPIPSKIYGMPPCTQTIQPWQFGDAYTKTTLLWLRGLPPLIPTDIVEPLQSWVSTGEKGGAARSPKKRSKTFEGIATAMAEQWGG